MNKNPVGTVTNQVLHNFYANVNRDFLMNITNLPQDLIEAIIQYIVSENYGKVRRKFRIQFSSRFHFLKFANHAAISNEYYAYFSNVKPLIAVFDMNHEFRRFIEVNNSLTPVHVCFPEFAVTHNRLCITQENGILITDTNGVRSTFIYLRNVENVHVYKNQVIVLSYDYVKLEKQIQIFNLHGGIERLLWKSRFHNGLCIFSVSQTGEIYMSDANPYCVHVFDLYGNLLREFIDHRIIYVRQIIIGPLDDVFIINYKQNRIEVFSTSGIHKRTIYTSSSIFSILLLPTGCILASLSGGIQLLE